VCHILQSAPEGTLWTTAMRRLHHISHRDAPGAAPPGAWALAKDAPEWPPQRDDCFGMVFDWIRRWSGAGTSWVLQLYGTACGGFGCGGGHRPRVGPGPRTVHAHRVGGAEPVLPIFADVCPPPPLSDTLDGVVGLAVVEPRQADCSGHPLLQRPLCPSAARQAPSAGQLLSACASGSPEFGGVCCQCEMHSVRVKGALSLSVCM